MADTDLLRASRDGDQFHYQWAARESLRLLRPDTDLIAIAVEGVSAQDTNERDGEQVVDLAEYYGSTDLREATRVVYRQLKHSTYRADQEWTVSGFEKTLREFSKKFRRISAEVPGSEQKVSFEFVTNRPVSDSVLHAVEALGSEQEASDDTREMRYLRECAGFGEERAAEVDFFGRFHIDPTAPGLVRLESLVRSAVAGILPGSTDVQHVMLKEMISRRATSLEPDNIVRRATVLAALATTEIELLPAPNLIRQPEYLVTTGQIQVIAEEIAAAADRPVIVHAAGGIGKSVLTTQLHHHLPAGSLTLVYDCFGDGGYRRSSQPRHQHQQGLVQLSNELATHVLCDPLVPVATAQPGQYSRAFLVRLQVAAETLATRCPGALLTIVVDAADNAAMIARDMDERTFVTDLLREQLPHRVRLVMLCRTERVDLLNPPPDAHKIELAGFGTEESARHLRLVFPEATDGQAAEFHRRTGGNPRIQAFVLEDADSLDACLASLGEAWGVDGSLLDELLRRRVADFKDHDRATACGIDRVCEALAALRPRIPVRVLSTLCSVPATLIHSFVADLSRPLLIDGGALQFRDEPTETWFRTHYRPSGAALTDFIDRLMPLADIDAYVAASLPELLWEAGQVDTLINLALTDGALPQGNDLEQLEIAQQRVQYALKATLRAGRDFEATRLALKAGTLAAGHSRTLRLLRSNTDLAGQFLDAKTVEDLVAARSLGGDWPGSNLHYEGALLSSAPGQSDLARSRLRSAVDWMIAWVRQSHDRGHGVEAHDIAEVAFGLLNAEGTEACIEFLSRWKPNRVAFDAGLIVANRLADVGRTDELERLAWSAVGVKYLRFAVACAAWRANYVCSAPVARRLVKMLGRQRRPVSFAHHRPWPDERLEVQAVVWIVAMGLRHGVLADGEAEKILRRSLPTTLSAAAASRHSSPVEPLLCGFALLARVRRRPFLIDEFASAEVLEAAQRPAYDHSHALTEYRRDIVPLADWAAAWITGLVGDDIDLDARFDQLADRTLKEYADYETPRVLINGIARLSGRIAAFGLSQQAQQRLLEWCRRHERYITTSVLVDLVRATAATPHTEDTAVVVAHLVRMSLDAAHVDAEEKADGMVALARATYRFDREEAAEHFAYARDLADRVGDDVHTRWKALLALAEAASSSDHIDDRRAYRVAQVVEGLEPYLGNGADHADALTAIARLSATTAVSVASRWCDRRFCADWAFIQAVTAANSPWGSNPLVALAMLPFYDGAAQSRLLEEALRKNPGEAVRVATVIGEFLYHTGVNTKLVDCLDRITRELGIDLTQTPLGSAIRRPTRRQTHHVATSTDWGAAIEADPEHAARKTRAHEALTACDLSTVEGWERARSIVDSRLGLGFQEVADRAVEGRISELSDTLAAFLAHPHFTVHDYAILADRLAGVTLLPRVVVKQIGRMAREATARFCRELTLKSYTVLDLDLLARLAGTDEDLAASALRHLGTHTTALDATECFTLAAFLARRLVANQAQIALDDLTRMSTQVAPVDFGDGNFESLPTVPDRLDQCIAGYVWRSLGDPEVTVRWRAAHCVRLMIGLGCIEELQALHDYATGELSHTAFTDARLPFYDKHALQWLLVALARAAQDPAGHESMCLFFPLLKRVLFCDAPHVVMQANAKAALTEMVSAGTVTLTAQEQAVCQRVNTPIGYIRTQWADRLAGSTGVRGLGGEETYNTVEPDQQPEALEFFLDFNQYWCEPLAEVFGLSADDVERRAADVVTERWGTRSGREEPDPRHTLGVYQHRRTYVYKDEWPEAEDLRFYIAVHALWTVAGDLLASYPVRHDEEDVKDSFSQWLGQFLISRDDGRWLADRRDPSPDSVFADENRAVEPDWIWRLGSHHFTQRLLLDDDWVTVWEYSDDATYEAEQEVRVHSALATPERARALVMALQTAPSYMAFRIPHACDDDYQYDVDGFELTGWIVVPHEPDGADTYDPFAGAVRYPPVHPSEDIVRMLGVTTDADMRAWTRDGRTALRSKVWDNTSDTGQGRWRGLRGQRLQIQRDFLQDLLQASERSLIVEVMINRTHQRLKQSHIPAWRHDDDDSLPILERSFKIYVFDESGGCEEL
ncbi:hypothetical protein ABT332_06235 [Saccharomonospora azurea]|uniref:hypothetical protein n=1 Tax=Saccharomonospora azurea TaxID=40988 RepID=UPI00331914DE